MPERPPGGFRHDLDRRHGLLRIEYRGRLTLAVILEEMAARFALPGVGRDTLLLADCSHAEIDEITLEALAEYQAAKLAAGHPDLRTAMVVPDRAGSLALAELWAATKPSGRGTGARVFTNESAAREWLLAPDKDFR